MRTSRHFCTSRVCTSRAIILVLLKKENVEVELGGTMNETNEVLLLSSDFFSFIPAYLDELVAT